MEIPEQVVHCRETKTLIHGITAINDFPTGSGDTKTTNEDTPVSGAVTGNDVDGDALTFTKASDPAHGTVVVKPRWYLHLHSEY